MMEKFANSEEKSRHFARWSNEWNMIQWRRQSKLPFTHNDDKKKINIEINRTVSSLQPNSGSTSSPNLSSYGINALRISLAISFSCSSVSGHLRQSTRSETLSNAGRAKTWSKRTIVDETAMRHQCACAWVCAFVHAYVHVYVHACVRMHACILKTIFIYKET